MSFEETARELGMTVDEYKQAMKDYEDEVFESDKDQAEYMLEKTEKAICEEYGINPPYEKKELSGKLPWYIFKEWDRYNSIVNPDIEAENNKSNFGINFSKSIDADKKIEMEDESAYDFEEESQLPADALPSARHRPLPKGCLNECTEDNSYSFDEKDDDYIFGENN